MRNTPNTSSISRELAEINSQLTDSSFYDPVKIRTGENLPYSDETYFPPGPVSSILTSTPSLWARFTGWLSSIFRTVSSTWCPLCRVAPVNGTLPCSCSELELLDTSIPSSEAPTSTPIRAATNIISVPARNVQVFDSSPMVPARRTRKKSSPRAKSRKARPSSSSTARRCRTK